MKQLEREVRQIINEVVCGEYVGKLKIHKEKVNDTFFWVLLLYLDRDATPLVMAYEGDLEGFKDFIKSEVKRRKLQGVKFWSTIQELPDNEYDE